MSAFPGEPPAEKPRLMLLMKSVEDFAWIVNCIAVQNGPIERVSSDYCCQVYRILIQPGVTCDDYMWGICPLDEGRTYATHEKLLHWTRRNGEYAFGIVHEPRAPFGDPPEGPVRLGLSLPDVAQHICRLVGASEEATARAMEAAARVHRHVHIVDNDRPPPQRREEAAVIDLSVYDPDDRVAIEAILAENERDGNPAAILVFGDREVERDPRQVAREEAFDARFRQGEAIRANSAARRLQDAVRHNPRPGAVPLRLPPANPPPVDPSPAAAGRVVGRVQNTRLREQVNARAAAARAREVVNNSDAAKRLVEPRLEKSDDVDAVATTVEDNTCVICVTSHVTTMLFPCLHYRFCSGCISAWKSGGNENCPVCRAKIELVLQPHGNLTLDDLRARSAVVIAAPQQAPVAAPPLTKAAEAEAPPAKKAKKEAAPPKRGRSTSKKKK